MTDNGPLLTNKAALLVGERLRSAMREQGLNGPELARLIGEQTGEVVDQLRLYKLLSDTQYPALVTVNPELYPLAGALGLDPAELVAGVVRDSQ